MAINKMAEVARMLGVELGEKFTIDRFDNTIYKILQSGFFFQCGDAWLQASSYVLIDIIKGELTIKKLPWKPKPSEKFFYVCWYHFPSAVILTGCSDYDLFSERECMRVDTGNCFKTREEAEAAKYDVFKRLTGKGWHETYGKGGDGNV